ncbi:Vacuolar protein sorting-associated protein ist1 [Coemansia erecta]|uniref:Vacuolar protein sorting-associated protein ist1 n=1 Tax=Coemansia erecta TaxID=147472 RepID=A0A9W8CT24_9FUNG|nr:Vacuolar protein sorting-associated protein ist1 [Coemansia erecta]
MAPFSLSKFKVELKLSINRLRLLQNKKSSLNAKARREIATLLETGKERSAYIRVENIIREDFNVEALEMVELYCELLTARAGLIEQSRTVDPGISEAVWSIIYASSRAEVRELTILRDMLTSKYGTEAVKSAMDNTEGQVDPKLVRKLSPQAPSAELVKLYLKEIASVYRINWRPAGEESDDDDTPSGGVKELAAPPTSFKAEDAESEGPNDSTDIATGVEDVSKDEEGIDTKTSSDKPVSESPAPENEPTKDAGKDKVSAPAKQGTPASAAKSPVPAFVQPKATKKPPPPSDGLPSLEELQKRFEALKQR